MSTAATTTQPSWAFEPPSAVHLRSGPGDLWLKALGVALIGYAVFGRGFAYLGYPPVFISELILASGLAVVVMGRGPSRMLPTLSLKLWALLLAWVVVRTVPYIAEYGTYAIRDAMIVGYGLFAAVVAALLLERPERLPEMLHRYRFLAWGVLGLGWILYLVYRMNQDIFPEWPWSPGVAIVANKPGDVVVHMGGITAFFLLGIRRATPLTWAIIILGTGATAVGNRGGMVGYILAMVVLTLMKPNRAKFGRMAFVGAFVIVAALAVDTSGIKVNEGSRSISAEQVWENVKSIFGQSDSFILNTTMEWRMLWWTQIVDYTIYGEYFLDGKGNLYNIIGNENERPFQIVVGNRLYTEVPDFPSEEDLQRGHLELTYIKDQGSGHRETIMGTETVDLPAIKGLKQKCHFGK